MIGSATSVDDSADEAWDKVHKFLLERHKLGPSSEGPMQWTRDEIYEERLSRYDRRTS